MIAYGPGFKGGKVIKELASLIDIPKTIVELAQKSPPEYMQGVSLLDLANNDLSRDEVFIQISESYVGRAIRTKKYKYCIIDPTKLPYEESHSLNYEEYYLYDLENDPLERVNLIKAKAYEDVRIELRTKMKEFIKAIENLDIEISICQGENICVK